MLVIPGQLGIDNCDRTLSRRSLLSVGGSSMLGVTLGNVLAGEARAKEGGRRAGWVSARPRT